MDILDIMTNNVCSLESTMGNATRIIYSKIATMADIGQLGLRRHRKPRR